MSTPAIPTTTTTTGALPPPPAVLPPLVRTAPRQQPSLPPPAASTLDDRLFARIDHVPGLRTKGIRWQYNQTLVPRRTCAFGRRTTLLWQPTETTPPLSLRHMLLRVTLPPLLMRQRPRHEARYTKLWYPDVVWHFFERIEFYLGENSEPVATIYPDANAWLLRTAHDPQTQHYTRLLLSQSMQLEKPDVQHDLLTGSWRVDVPLVLPCTQGDNAQWFVRGLGDQALRLVVTLRDTIECVYLDDARLLDATRKQQDPLIIAKRYRLPLDLEIEWLASKGYASKRYAATLGYKPNRTQYSMPWLAVQRVGQLHADTWHNKFSDMSYWQIMLHDSALTSALLFVLQYDAVDSCEDDVTPFESIEILLGVERLTKIAYDDASMLAETELAQHGLDDTLNIVSQVVLVPFCDDPLARHHSLDQTTFVDMSIAPVTVRFLQPSRRATKTMERIRVYAVRLSTLSWSSTTNSLHKYIQ